MKKNKIDEVYMACMRELYSSAIGFNGKSGDFNTLLANATIDKEGRKHIPMDDYYLSQEQFTEIVEKHIGKKIKGLQPYERSALSQHLYLGATPTCNKENWEERRLQLNN